MRDVYDCMLDEAKSRFNNRLDILYIQKAVELSLKLDYKGKMFNDLVEELKLIPGVDHVTIDYDRSEINLHHVVKPAVHYISLEIKLDGEELCKTVD